jgi:segregation and condensation protein B
VLVAHDPVAPELLAQLLEQPIVMVEQWCEELRASTLHRRPAAGSSSCSSRGGWIRLPDRIDDQTPYVERFVLHDQKARLSGAALETLAIIAYKQPISRAQMASIRGVDPDGVIRTLQARGYIDEVGRDHGPGQAILFGTTPQFLEKLGLAPLDDLPPIAEFIPRCRRGRAARDTGCVSPRPTSTSRAGEADECGDGARRLVSDRTPEPPLWEQMAARTMRTCRPASASRRCWQRRVWEPSRLRGPDRCGPGDGQR